MHFLLGLRVSSGLQERDCDAMPQLREQQRLRWRRRSGRGPCTKSIPAVLHRIHNLRQKVSKIKPHARCSGSRASEVWQWNAWGPNVHMS